MSPKVDNESLIRSRLIRIAADLLRLRGMDVSDLGWLPVTTPKATLRAVQAKFNEFDEAVRLHAIAIKDAADALAARNEATQGEPDFWSWLDRAYQNGSEGDAPKFTKWNMQVAYEAGRGAAWTPVETPPPVNTHVLVLLKSGCVQKMMYHNAEWLADGYRTGIVPTHWRPVR